jgi:hypothetical protein
VYLKVTGGLLQGYRGQYKDKIPLNRFGVAPVIIPSVAHYGPLAAELVFLGANAAMVTSGVRFKRGSGAGSRSRIKIADQDRGAYANTSARIWCASIPASTSASSVP